MGRFAVFVDAGYFWVQTISAALGTPKGIRTDIVVDFPQLRAELLSHCSSILAGRYAALLRVYWYDGPGQHGKGLDHRSIDDLDDFKLRLGTRNSQGQQKAVDGLIIADMLSLAQSRAIDTAFLVSGDADLAPGVIAAQALGLRVHLGILAPATSTSPYLAAEVDTKFHFPSGWVQRFATPSLSLGVTTSTITATSVAVSASTVHSAASKLQPTPWIDAVAAKFLTSQQSSPNAGMLASKPKSKGLFHKQSIANCS